MAIEIFSRSHLCSRGVKDSLFLRLKIGDSVGIGEYSPLGLHTHSLKDAYEQCRSLEYFDMPNASLDELRNFFASFKYPLSYLLSQAHFSASCQKKTINDKISLCGLIETNFIKEAKNLSSSFRERGYAALKIKVGTHAIGTEMLRLDGIISSAGSMKIRLDANQRLSLKDAESLVRDRLIDYFEEPLKNIEQTKKLEGLVSLAIDESFGPGDDLNNFKNASVLVLKPSRFHSIYDVKSLALNAQKLGFRVILSHCFESEVSTAIFSLLAHELKLSEPQGILAGDFFMDERVSQINLNKAQELLMSFS